MNLLPKIGLIAAFNMLAGCNLTIAEKQPTEVNKQHMIEIARQRDCLHLFPGVETFDGCIYRMQPYFDPLPLKDKKEVALNFVIYGNLETGSSIMFAELISPCNPQITKYLQAISDNTLQREYWVWPWQVSEYRKQVKKFTEYNLRRGSNGVDFPQVECNL